MSDVRKAFLAATAGDVWVPVAEVAARLAESTETVLDLAARILDTKGWPLVAAIEERDPETGQWRFVLKQEARLSAEDYARAVAYHRAKASAHQAVVDEFR